MNSTFCDRDEPIRAICDLTTNALLNVYGEAGIGKSRLLQEAKLNLERDAPSTLVLIIDIEPLGQTATDRPAALLQALIHQAEGKLKSSGQNNEQTAESIVSQLNELAAHTSVYLMFDTTEVLQDDAEFWDWLHLYITEPLVIEGKVKQIYAGRIPVPWRRFELRRAVRLLPLGPITPEETIKAWIIEVLQQTNPMIQGPEMLDQLADLVLDFSFGHPLLSKELALYIARHWPISQPFEQFRKTLCEQRIVTFVNSDLFQGIDSLWREILWWISVLDWFDSTILQQYIKRVMPELEEKPDYFFIREVARLRTHNRVVWQEQQGERLHGLIKNIVRQCLKTVDKDRYERACLAAAETFQSIAAEFSEEASYAQQFKNEAERYRQQLSTLKEATL